MMRKAAFGAIAGARRRAPDPAIYTTWVTRVDAAGGTYTANSKNYALALANALVGASYYSKIVWLLPLLGNDIIAARVPLVDTLNVGIAGNTNFLTSDFSETTGLQGDGLNKRLAPGIKPSQLGSSNNGGIGYWENNINFTGSGSEPMGCYGNAGASRFVLDLRSTRKFVSWGNAGNLAGPLTAATNGHYYGQRASATSRELFFAGSSVGTNTTSDAATGASDRNMYLMASDQNPSAVAYWKGRCAVAYMTDGTFSSGDASAFDTLLSTNLITPTGR